MHAGRTLGHMTDVDARPRRLDWSLNAWGARLLYSLIAGTVVNLIAGSQALGAVVAVVLFVLTTAIVAAVRRG